MKQYVIAWVATRFEDNDTEFGILEQAFETYVDAKKYLAEVEVPDLKKTIEEYYSTQGRADVAVDIEVNILDNANEQPYVGSIAVFLNGDTEEYYQYKICCVERRPNKLLNGIRV